MKHFQIKNLQERYYEIFNKLVPISYYKYYDFDTSNSD